MYKNVSKMTVSLCIWSLLMVIGLVGAFAFLGVFFENLRTDPPINLFIDIVLGAACSMLVVTYVRRMKFFGFIQRVDRFFVADDDGFVPLDDVAAAVGRPGLEVIKLTRKAIGKRFMINFNYDSEKKAFLLSDKISKPGELFGVGTLPEDRPFVGISCPGCAASLKIRVQTPGTCPFCGREIMVSGIDNGK